MDSAHVMNRTVHSYMYFVGISFLTVAGRSWRTFSGSASKVLAFLNDQEEFETELGELTPMVNLDGEGEDEEEPEAV